MDIADVHQTVAMWLMHVDLDIFRGTTLGELLVNKCNFLTFMLLLEGRKPHSLLVTAKSSLVVMTHLDVWDCFADLVHGLLLDCLVLEDAVLFLVLSFLGFLSDVLLKHATVLH